MNTIITWGSAFLYVVFFALAHYAVLAALAVVSYVIGRKLTAKCKYHSIWERVTFSISLGLGVIASLIFVLGLLRWLYVEVVLGLLALLAVLCASTWKELGKELLAFFAHLPKQWLLIGGVGIVFFLPFLILPLYPPTAWDATMYHLALVETYVKNHELTFTPYFRFSLFPQINQMLFTLMLMFSDDISAQLVQFLMMVLVALVLYAWALRLFSPRVGLWAAALWLGNPIVVWLGASAYIDIGMILFILLGTYTLYNWIQTQDIRWLVLSSVFCGFAAASKYSALVFVAAFGVVVAVHSIARQRKLIPILIFGVLIGLIAGPWYVRSYYYSGNPVLPYFPQLFGTGYLTPEEVQGSLGEQRSHGVGHAVSELIKLPWHLTFNLAQFHSEAPLNPFYLMLMPLWLIALWRNRHIGVISVLVIAYVIFWFFSFQILRYLLPIFPMISLAAAASLEHFAGRLRDRFPKPYIVLAVFATCLFISPAGAYAVYRIQGYGLPPTTREQREIFLARIHTPYEAIRYLNERRGQDYAVYVLYAENMAYFVQGLFLGDWIGPAGHGRVLQGIKTGADLYQKLKALGADYFLYTTHRYRWPLPEDPSFDCTFKLIYAKPYIQLFELAQEGICYQRVLGEELLLNPGLEALQDSQLVGWERVGNPQMEIETNRGKIARCDAENFWTQHVAVRPGKFYILRAWMKATVQSAYGRLHINWRDREGRLLQVDIQTHTLGPQWQEYSAAFMVPEGASIAQIVTDVYGDNAVQYDDFSLRSVDYILTRIGD